MANAVQIIQKFSKKNILVIGDVILDRYIQGTVTRISPEAPVPIVLEKDFFYKPGGAANVAHNLSQLGAKVTQVGIIGNDFEGQLLKRSLKRLNTDISGMFVDKYVPTITKTRVIAQNQQVVRIDKEKISSKHDLQVTKKIGSFIQRRIDEFDGVILSDYGKGLITPELVNMVCELAQKKKKILTVDPKIEHFEFYRKVTAITPNLKEAENAIKNIKITSRASGNLKIHTARLDSDERINQAGEELLNFLHLECLLITLGEHGMRLFEKGKAPVSIKTKAQEVFDVTGAGDAVISVFTLALAAKASKRQAANLANLAAGIVVGKLGAIAVTKDELLATVKNK
ncbi:MAG: D-glycero-beta-D-manno-heptose-7-phosphate kinase [Candidatus Omnitrophica bacterium]|nr:D-glycero-beta-D-manno-heptose-7-phosphate kinase [Candidatus Omnitrophota bacterium]